MLAGPEWQELPDFVWAADQARGTVGSMHPDPLDCLEASIADTTDVYVGAGWDREVYLNGVERGLRESICTPFPVSAIVAEPGFPDAAVGTVISGICIAHSNGYWLVHQSERNRFLCFWGVSADQLSAPGIFGTPLGCWTA